MENMEPDGDAITQWIGAIKADDVSMITTILDRQTTDKRSVLLYGCLKLMEDDKITLSNINKKYRILARCTPIELALAYNSRDVIKVFLNNGLDLTRTGNDHETLVHYIIRLCDIKPDAEEDLVDLYQWFIELISNDVKRKILGSENKRGLRPLELAAEHGFFKLFRTILETKSVYLVDEEEIGALTYQRFDITDYEGASCKRLGKSPLAFITFMKEDCLSKPQIGE
jgi:hypothetical protein